MVNCQPELPTLRDGTAGEVALTLVEWAAIYHDCRTIHSGLIEALQHENHHR